MVERFSLLGRNIVITGASSGIGRQCAIACSEMGARIIAIGRDKDTLAVTLSKLSGSGHIQIIHDITNYDLTNQIISELVAKNGPIDGFIHSAGIELSYPFNLTKPVNYEKLFSVNVIAGFELAKNIAKLNSLSKNGASFVFIASIMGVTGNAGLTAYSASKGALIAGARSMAVELAAKKIRVNAISPGYIEDTPMTNKSFSMLDESQVEKIRNQHLLGFGNTDDIANASIFLLSDAGKWITGTNLIVDGGYSVR